MSTTNQVFQAPQPLIMKAFTIALDKDEQSLTVPFCLHHNLRVAHAKYSWNLFLGAASPNSGCGTQGDVWVTTIPGYENVYIRGEDDKWNVWYKTIDYGQKRYCNDSNKFLHSYHPWLRDRLLQFNGTDLGWHPRRLYYSHRQSWNAKRPAGYPEYDSLDSMTIARYVKAVHLPRPALFGGVQPTASTSSSSNALQATDPRPAQPVRHIPTMRTVPNGVQPSTPISLPSASSVTASRPAQSVQPMPTRRTVSNGVQPAASSLSTGQQQTTTRPSTQQTPAAQKLAARAAQPTAQTSLPPATTARPAPPPRPVAQGGAQSAAPSSSATFPPATPAQPPLRGPSSTGVGVQPAASTTSSSLPTAVGVAPQVQPTAAPEPQATASSGGTQLAAPTSTPPLQSTTTLPAQPASTVSADPPKYEDVVSEIPVKRRRSSSLLSYASKERSPSPKRPNLGLKVGGSSDDQPSLSCSCTAPVETPPTSMAPPATTTTSAPPTTAPSIPPSSAAAVQPLPTPEVQPSPVHTSLVPAVQPSPAPATQPSLASSHQPPPTPAVQPGGTPAPQLQPQPVRPASAQNPASMVIDAVVPAKPPQLLDAAAGAIASENDSQRTSPQDPAGTDLFLSSLPLSLSRHTTVFTTMGVTNGDHFRLLAQLLKHSLDKFLATVRERGLSFMESLVLRSALNGLRQPSENPQAQADATTIEAWLEHIGPSVVRHAHVFRDLGIDSEHVPVLAQLDAETFQEFENALETAGLTWVDRVVITAKIRDDGRQDVQQEPLLVA